MRDESVAGGIDAEFLESAGDAALVGQPARCGAEVVDASTYSVEVGVAGSVVQGQLVPQSLFHLDDEDFGDGVQEVVVPFAGEDLVAFGFSELRQELRGVDQQEPHAADRDLGGSLAEDDHGALTAQDLRAAMAASALSRASNQYS